MFYTHVFSCVISQVVKCHIAGNIGGGNYIWRIGGFPVTPPILNLPILRQLCRLPEKVWRSYLYHQIYICQLQFSSKYYSRQYIQLYIRYTKYGIYYILCSNHDMWCSANIVIRGVNIDISKLRHKIFSTSVFI